MLPVGFKSHFAPIPVGVTVRSDFRKSYRSGLTSPDGIALTGFRERLPEICSETKGWNVPHQLAAGVL